MRPELSDFNFCTVCGGNLEITFHEGYSRPVCGLCGHVVYVNPVPAACQIVLDGTKILLVKRAVDPGKGLWCLPGGFIEWGESPHEGAKRELFEETGLTAGELSHVGIYDGRADSRRHILLIAYRILSWSGDPVAGDDAVQVKWFDIHDLPPLAFSSHTQAIRDVLQGEEIR